MKLIEIDGHWIAAEKVFRIDVNNTIAGSHNQARLSSITVYFGDNITNNYQRFDVACETVEAARAKAAEIAAAVNSSMEIGSILGRAELDPKVRDEYAQQPKPKQSK